MLEPGQTTIEELARALYSSLSNSDTEDCLAAEICRISSGIDNTTMIEISDHMFMVENSNGFILRYMSLGVLDLPLDSYMESKITAD